MSKKVRFHIPYRGVLTGEKYYYIGDETNLADDAAATLQDRGIIELVDVASEPDDTAQVDEPVAELDPAAPLLDLMSTKELRALAKDAKIKGYSRMKRETLIDRLS
jgi:hypothetical protein